MPLSSGASRVPPPLEPNSTIDVTHKNDGCVVPQIPAVTRRHNGSFGHLHGTYSDIWPQ